MAAFNIYGNLKDTLIKYIEPSGDISWAYSGEKEAYEHTQNDAIFTISFEQARYADRRNTNITTYAIRTIVFRDLTYEQENNVFLDFQRQVDTITDLHRQEIKAVGVFTNSTVNRQTEFVEVILLYDFTSIKR